MHTSCGGTDRLIDFSLGKASSALYVHCARLRNVNKKNKIETKRNGQKKKSRETKNLYKHARKPFENEIGWKKRAKKKETNVIRVLEVLLHAVPCNECVLGKYTRRFFYFSRFRNTQVWTKRNKRALLNKCEL